MSCFNTQFDGATISSGPHVTFEKSADFVATAQLSAKRAIVCHRRASPNPRGVCELLTLNSGSAPTAHGAVSTSIYGGAASGAEIEMVALSDNAAVVCGMGPPLYCHGLTVTGTTLNVGKGFAVGESFRAQVAMVGVDSTRAILCFFDSSAGYKSTCVIITHDQSANTVSYGTELTLPQANSGQHYRPKHMTLLSSTTALLAISEYSNLDYTGAVLSVAGTTLSLIRTGKLTGATAGRTSIDPRVARVDAGTVIHCYGDQKNSGAGGTWCVVVDVSISGFAVGTFVQLESRNHGNNGIDMVGIGSGAAIVCWRGTSVISGSRYAGNCLAVRADKSGTKAAIRPSPLSGQTISQFLNGVDGSGGDGEYLSLSSLASPSVDGDSVVLCYRGKGAAGRCRELELSIKCTPPSSPSPPPPAPPPPSSPPAGAYNVIASDTKVWSNSGIPCISFYNKGGADYVLNTIAGGTRSASKTGRTYHNIQIKSPTQTICTSVYVDYPVKAHGRGPTGYAMCEMSGYGFKLCNTAGRFMGWDVTQQMLPGDKNRDNGCNRDTTRACKTYDEAILDKGGYSFTHVKTIASNACKSDMKCSRSGQPDCWWSRDSPSMHPTCTAA